jgi:hypothetical protein
MNNECTTAYKGLKPIGIRGHGLSGAGSTLLVLFRVVLEILGRYFAAREQVWSGGSNKFRCESSLSYFELL